MNVRKANTGLPLVVVVVILLIISIGGNVAQAQEKPKRVDQAEIELAKLPPAERVKLGKHMQRASVYVRGKNQKAALDELEAAELIASKWSAEFFQFYNLKGVAYLRLESFDQARQAFRQAAKVSPDPLRPRLNLAGIEIVTSKVLTDEKKVELQQQLVRASTLAEGEQIEASLKEIDGAIAEFGGDTPKDLIAFKEFVASMKEKPTGE